MLKQNWKMQWLYLSNPPNVEIKISNRHVILSAFYSVLIVGKGVPLLGWLVPATFLDQKKEKP